MSVTCAPVPAYPPTVIATTSTPPPVAEVLVLDIEHIPVEDDPRNWSKARKVDSLIALSPLPASYDSERISHLP